MEGEDKNSQDGQWLTIWAFTDKKKCKIFSKLLESVLKEIFMLAGEEHLMIITWHSEQADNNIERNIDKWFPANFSDSTDMSKGILR